MYEPGLLGRLSKKAYVIVTAMSSTTAFRPILELVGRCVSVVDASFFHEDPYVLDETLENRRNTLIIGAGFAPGYSSVVAGYAYHKYKLKEELEISARGIPVLLHGSLEFKGFTRGVH